MRLSARITIFVALALSLALHVSAFDQNDYKAYAEELRRSVWEQDLPEFQNVKTTDRFSNHSAVILAAYDEYSVTHKNKFNLFSVNGLSQELNSYSLWREMVQLNDETALKAYSEYDFMAYASRRSFFYGKFEMRNVLGVSLTNAAGSFSVEPSLVGGKLVMEAHKTVRGTRIPVAEWPQMLELYDAIYDYNSRQVVLKAVE